MLPRLGIHGCIALTLLGCGGQSSEEAAPLEPSRGNLPNLGNGGTEPSENEPDEEGDVPASQAIVWLSLATAEQGTCTSTRTFELPLGAHEAIVSDDATGDRIVDGPTDSVQCRITQVPGSNESFELDLQVSSGEVGLFRATGVVTPTIFGSSLDVELTTTSSSLQQDGCVATAKVVNSLGAVWLQALSCPALRDPSSPGVVCAGSGGVIFENCDID